MNTGKEQTVGEKPLSKKHLAFVDNYFLCGMNATEAYFRTYRPKDRGQCRSNGARLMANDGIKAEIEARLAEMHMGADEALKLVSEIARGDIAQLMDVSSIGFNLDMKKAQELGLTRLIKKVKQKTVTKIGKKDDDEDVEITELEVELYDAQAAQRDILKIHGRFKENVDITSGGEKIKGYVTVSPEDWDK